MPKGKKKKSNSSFVPAERFLRFQLQHSENQNEVSHFIDIAKELSKVNRRLYRQGMVYRIANISITSRDTVNGLVSFSSAPETWVTRNAWNRGYNLYEKMNKQVLEHQPGRKSRYHDFKVYLSNDHRNAAAAQLPGAVDNENNAYGEGEWEYSEFVSPDGTTGADKFNSHLLGGHAGSAGNYSSVGLVLSYGESRGTVPRDIPQFDTGGDDDPLLNLFDDGSQVDEIASDLDTDGDLPPYFIDTGASLLGESYTGSSNNGPNPIVRRLASIGSPDQLAGGDTAGVSAPTVMLPGFDAICGLIEIETQSRFRNKNNLRTDLDEFDVIIELAPGPYKGVAAFDI